MALFCSLAACSQTTEASDKNNAKLPKPQTSDWPTRLETEPQGKIGDGVVRPMLQTMAYDEYSQSIEMGMGCAFVALGKNPLFVATAPDDAKTHGKAAIKLNDTVVILTHKDKGIAQVEAGGTFTTEAVEVTINHLGGEPIKKGIESYYWPAALKIVQDEGGDNLYEGIYECGA